MTTGPKHVELAALVAACISALLLVACGGGSPTPSESSAPIDAVTASTKRLSDLTDRLKVDDDVRLHQALGSEKDTQYTATINQATTELAVANDALQQWHIGAAPEANRQRLRRANMAMNSAERYIAQTDEVRRGLNLLGAKTVAAPAVPSVFQPSDVWLGSYTYAHACGAAGITGNMGQMMEDYKVSIRSDGNMLIADIDSDGWQLADRLSGSVSAHDGQWDQIDISFDHYRDQKLSGAYQSGDLLFSIRRADQGAPTTLWGKLGAVCTAGSGVYFEKVETAAELRAECVKGLSYGCGRLSQMVASGANSDAQSSDVLARACDVGVSTSICSMAATMMKHTDVARAGRLANKGCDGGDWLSCSTAVDIFTPSDLVAAAAAATKECNLLPSTCAQIAEMYEVGKGVPKDSTKSRALYVKGCAAEDIDACAKVNPARARDLRAKACDNDALLASSTATGTRDAIAATMAEACEALGKHTRACDLGRTDSCDKLCKQGNVNACPHASSDVSEVADRARADANEAAARARAERALPDLFAKCATNRAIAEHWRVTGITARRAGDQAEVQHATQELEKVAPVWSDTLGKLGKAIQLITDGQGPRFVQLVQRVDAECNCKSTPSGRCR